MRCRSWPPTSSSISRTPSTRYDRSSSLLGEKLLHEQRGQVLPGEVEHFGFRDGVSQVGVRGRLSEGPRHFLTRRWLDPADRRAREFARPGQPLVWPGQFVYGYPAGTHTDALAPGDDSDGGPSWTVNGSMLVLRLLRQEVPAFNSFIADKSRRLRELGRSDMNEQRLAASLVGRWPDGTSLIRSPLGPDHDQAADMLAINNFTYASDLADSSVCSDPLVAGEALAAAAVSEVRTVAGSTSDPRGEVCPKFAHIRKVNPRDLPTDEPNGELGTRTFQMLRRGITWGTRFIDGEDLEAADRGLIFMSYQANIKAQFEQLQIRWMNEAGPPETGQSGQSGHDLLVGQNNEGPRTADLLPNEAHGLPGVPMEAAAGRAWITPVGGDYFFVPALTTLRQLATEPRPDPLTP